MSRRGIGAMFAWIFVMVAGALIIALFFTIANSQLEGGKERLALTALGQVNTIITTQATSYDTATQVPIPESDIRLHCVPIVSDDQLTLFSELDIGGLTRPIEDTLVTGRDFETDQLLLFSKQWRAPYRLGNVLMVGSPDEILLIENNTALTDNTQAFAELFPPEVPKQVFDAGSQGVNARLYDNVRVVEIGKDSDVPGTPFPSADMVAANQEDATYIYVGMRNNDILDKGSVYYYTYEDGAWTRTGPFEYVGEGMLAGLVWQADPVRASCLQHKLAQTLQRQTELQIQRLDLLTDRYGGTNTQCGSNYGTSSLQALSDAPGEPQVDTYEPMGADEDGALYEFRIADAVNNVERKNQGILVSENCATIY